MAQGEIRSKIENAMLFIAPGPIIPPMKWRLLDSGLSEPAFTVAADEAIALARAKGIVPNTLHFYRRDSPTVSLGYFQKVDKAIDIDFCKANGVRIVRRVTGGSAIYTDSNHLIYGLAVDEDTLPADREMAFRKVCSALVIALAQMGIPAVHKPINDVLVSGRKISGSAQIKRRGIVLQHGTLVLKNDTAMMKGALRMDEMKLSQRGLTPSTCMTSLFEIMGNMPDIEKVKASLVYGFEKEFNVHLEPSEFTSQEAEIIDGLVQKKYSRDEWNLKY